MITNQIPENWKDLQDKVAEILEQCGFNVEVEKKIKSVRGSVEIDVYAEENIKKRTYSILCECKHWKSNIPQNIIHGFRTILSDLGANIGYIITTSDFQSGSVESVENTNIKLLTWTEFQNVFFESWYTKHFCYSIRQPSLIYYNYDIVDWFDDLNSEDRLKYFNIRNILNEIDEIQNLFPLPYTLDIEGIENSYPVLPLEKNHIDLENYFGDLPKSIFKMTDYESFLKEFTEFRTKIVHEFIKLDEKYKSE